MLAADKLELTSSIRKNATDLKGKELELHRGNFEAVGTQAAVLAGFAICMVIKFDMPDDVHVMLQYAFYLFGFMTLVFNLGAVVMTTCINVLSTGLALRGPDGSMLRSVDGLYTQRIKVFWSFALGIVACCISVIFLAWIKMTTVPALISSLLISWAMVSGWRMQKDYEKLFAMNDADSVVLDDVLGFQNQNKESIMKTLGVDSKTALAMLRTLSQHRSRAVPEV
eukprot:TRINITY_DN61258_c0_g1_i1.p2 TRINITY_DN61258_c0_g1~~TRINITY_DN61258_c0_g1_i1.p2  ORF type:complete len:225 (-),score=47.99 TRINITY_DN61258_c0_g1_i1:120-794(-)